MPTLCLLVYKHGGRYYEFLERNGYPEQAGDLFVNQIPSDSSHKYQLWLETKKCLLHSVELRVRYSIRAVPPMHQTQTGLILHSRLDEVTRLRINNEEGSISSNAKLDGLPSTSLPLERSDLRWIYCIDLDREVYSVCNRYHFRLADIPKDWITVVRRARANEPKYFILPPTFYSGSHDPEAGMVTLPASITPRVIPKGYCCPLPKIVIVRAKPLDALVSGKRIALRFVHGLFLRMKAASKRAYWEYLRFCNMSSRAVRETIVAMLCLAHGSPEYLSFIQISQLRGQFRLNKHDVHFGTLLRAKDCEAEVISSLAVGCHRNGELPHLAPESNIFWFDEVMICLWDHLDEGKNAQEAIRYVMVAGGLQRRNFFHAIIVSLEHVIVLQILPQGEVQRTVLLPFIGISEADDTTTALYDIHSQPLYELDAFVAIAQLFEAAKLQRLRKERSHSNCVLPPEVMAIIVSFTDATTRICLSATSRELRYACQSFCSFTSNSILLEERGAVVLSVKGEGDYYHIEDPPESIRQVESSPYSNWIAVVGSRHRTRSLLSDAIFQFRTETKFDPAMIAHLYACV